MLLRYLRLKLLHWYLIIILAAITPLYFIFFINFKQSLYNAIDNNLEHQSNTIIESIEQCWEYKTKKNPSLTDGVIKKNKLEQPECVSMLKHIFQIRNKNIELSQEILQVFNTQKQLIISSKSLPETKIYSSYNLEKKATRYYKNIELRTPKFGIRKMRVLTAYVFEETGLSYIVQVLAPTGSITIALENLRFHFLLSIPAILIIAGLLGSILVRINLKPLDQVISVIQKISTDNLNADLAIPQGENEVNQLTQSLNQLLKKLNNALAGQKRFIQDASHELRTPLTILKGEIGLALKKDRTNSEYKEVLFSSLEEIENLTKIVEHLLMLVKFDSLEMTLECKSTEIKPLILQVTKHIDVLAKKKNIQLKTKIENDLYIFGDKQYLKQVFVALIDNAIKYNNNGGMVIIKARQQEKNVTITIEDNGIGIAEQDIIHVFQRFYRSQNSIGGGFGYGIGLNIVKTLVELHKGVISLESEEGKGSKFTVIFPLYQA